MLSLAAIIKAFAPKACRSLYNVNLYKNLCYFGSDYKVLFSKAENLVVAQQSLNFAYILKLLKNLTYLHFFIIFF